MPDASNILQLSKLFGVTTDYLLNDDYQSDNDLPKIKEVQNDDLGQIMIYLVTFEVMVLLMQFMTTVILQKLIFQSTRVIYQKSKNRGSIHSSHALRCVAAFLFLLNFRSIHAQ